MIDGRGSRTIGIQFDDAFKFSVENATFCTTGALVRKIILPGSKGLGPLAEVWRRSLHFLRFSKAC